MLHTSVPPVGTDPERRTLIQRGKRKRDLRMQLVRSPFPCPKWIDNREGFYGGKSARSAVFPETLGCD